MSSIQYSYDVRIAPGAKLFHSDFGSALPGCAEMVISSKKFYEFDQCTQSLQNLMSFLGVTESKASNRSQVIVLKKNPMLDPQDNVESNIDVDDWENTILFRTYIADAEELKLSKFKSHVVGQVRITTQSIDAIKDSVPQQMQ